MMSPDFQHILRVLNTNIDGRRKVMFALCKIQGIGRRFSNLICKKAEVDPTKRCVWDPRWLRFERNLYWTQQLSPHRHCSPYPPPQLGGLGLT